MFKIENVKDLKEIIRQNSEKEEVSPESVAKARASLHSMFITNTQDAFLYFSSLNLLNTYVKTHKDMSYDFKRFVNSGIEGILANNVKDATFCYDEKEKVMLVDIAGMQFSFHNVLPNASVQYLMLNPADENGKYYKQEEWEGIRLQSMAETLFDFANNLDDLSNTSLAGNLKDYQKECVEMMKEGAERE